MSTPYPNAHQIEEIFSTRDNPTVFNTHLADPISVTVAGQDFHLAGNYTSVQSFHDEIYNRITASFKPGTHRIEVLRVIGGGESPWAAVESLATAETIYGKQHRVELVDLVRFNSQGKIAQLKEFPDSHQMHAQIEEHESKTKKEAT